jgi:HTH-type transcriptional regulator/antitoxin HigA
MKAKVLKTEHDYKAALVYLERLMSASAPDEDALELWSLLVEKYEEEYFPIATPDPIEAIRFRMDQAGLQPADLNPYLQSKSKVSEVMNRKRPLSLSMIRALHRGLKIPAEVLVQETQAPYAATLPKHARVKQANKYRGNTAKTPAPKPNQMPRSLRS